MVCQDQDSIIFSIRAAGLPPGNWHGGELVVMDVNAPAAASFLFHGGHFWDHAFSPAAAFGVPTDEVDAIEAWNGPYGKQVPALTNWGLLVLLVLLVISGIIVIRHRRRGVVRA